MTNQQVNYVIVRSLMEAYEKFVQGLLISCNMDKVSAKETALNSFYLIMSYPSKGNCKNALGHFGPYLWDNDSKLYRVHGSWSHYYDKVRLLTL